MIGPKRLDKLWAKAMNLAGFKSRTVGTGDRQMHAFVVDGHGPMPPLLMLHGLGANAAGYSLLMQLLKSSFQQIIVPDLPGHGLSTAPDELHGHEYFFALTTELLSELIERPVIVFGNSLGGAYAMHWAHHRPELTAGLILLSPAGTPMEHPEIDKLIAKFDGSTLTKGRDMAMLMTHDMPIPVAWLLAPIMRRTLSQDIVRKLLSRVAPGQGMQPHQLAGLTMPILLIWGQSERLLPPEHLEYLSAHLPVHAVIARPEKFGHCPYLDRPLEVTRLIVDFARQATTS